MLLLLEIINAVLQIKLKLLDLMMILLNSEDGVISFMMIKWILTAFTVQVGN